MSSEVAPRDRLTELGESNALLGSALTELRSTGITNATADALVGVRVSDGEFSEFLDLAARNVPQASMFGLALSLPDYIIRRGVGHDALDYCISHGNLSDHQLTFVLMHMDGVSTPDAIVWWHERLTKVIRKDGAYYRFLVRHIAFVQERCHDEMIAYLLHPNRGPAPTNIDAFELVIRTIDDPGPFFRRWQEWVVDGFFDRPGTNLASLHYQILNQCWDEPAYRALREMTHSHVLSLLSSTKREDRVSGFHHLQVMVEDRYLGADYVVHQLLPRVRDVPRDEIRRLALMRRALSATAAANAAPDDRGLREAADKLRSEVISSGKDW